MGDKRRSYVHLVPGALDDLTAPALRPVPRCFSVCSAHSARSHLAAALWRQASDVTATSAGTHLAATIAPGTVETARRHRLDLPQVRPQHVAEVRTDGDLVVTVCDRTHEELDFPYPSTSTGPSRTPLLAGMPDAFDHALEEIGRRVGNLAPRLAALPSPTKTAATSVAPNR